MPNLAQQLYLAEQAMRNTQQGGMPQAMPQIPQEQSSANPLDVGSMEAINAVRRSMGLPPGDKPIKPGLLDLISLGGTLWGANSKVPWFAKMNQEALANFDPMAKERERIAQNTKILQYLADKEKERQEQLYKYATFGETIRAHDLGHEEKELARNEAREYRLARDAMLKGEKEARRLEREERTLYERNRQENELTKEQEKLMK